MNVKISILSLVLMAGATSLFADNNDKGIDYYKAGMYSYAKKALFENIQSGKTDKAEAYYYLGEIYAAENMKDSAAYCYKQGLVADPEYVFNTIGEIKLDLAATPDVDKVLAGFTTGNTTEFHIQHILIPIDHPDNTEKLKKHAEEIAERARAGEDFAMLAATYSRASDALQGGDIGWRNLQSLPNVMADVLKESPRKGVYIIKGKDSWDVMRVSDTRDGVQFKLAGGPVEQTHARHILMLVSDITPEGEVIHRLNDIKRRIDAGESDFATMARLHSVDNSATRGGDLGWLQPGDTVPEFEKAMNSLKPNEVSEPIKSQFGYHLIQVIERRMEKNGNPQRMRIAARQQLREKKLGEAVYNWQRELRDRAYVEIRDSHY